MVYAWKANGQYGDNYMYCMAGNIGVELNLADG